MGSGVVVLNPAAVDGYGNPISIERDDAREVNRLFTTGIVENQPTEITATDGYGNPISFTRDDDKEVNRLMTSSIIENIPDSIIATDGYGNPISVVRDESIEANRVLTRTQIENTQATDGYGNPISIVRDTSIDANRVLTSAAITLLPRPLAATKVVSVEFYKTGVADSDYFLGIDIDNGSGNYKHFITTGFIRLVGASGTIIKDKNQDVWRATYGCILSINETQATVGYLQVGTMYAADTNQFIDRYTTQTFPVELDLTVSGGDYTKVAVSETETTTDINTGITLKDVVGSDVAPAVGDLVVKVTKISENGSGTVDVHYSLWYYTE